MSSGIINYPKFKAFDTNGAPLAGGLLYAYEMGTTTPKDTYTSVGLSVPNTNPVVLDSLGEAVVFGSGTYKLALADSDDVTIWTFDGVEFAAAGASKVSSADTTAGFLEDKLDAGANILITKQNTGANESLLISVTGALLTSAIGVTVQAYDAATAKTDEVQSWTRQQYPEPVVLVNLSSLSCDLHAFASYQLVNGVNTLPTVSAQSKGKIIELELIGSSTSSLAFSANWKATDAVALPTSPAAGKKLWLVAESSGGFMYARSATKEV